MDIMTLGGESGSPIFRADSPDVLGLLHAGFPGTNITLAVPSFLVAEAFANYRQSVALDFNGVIPFETAASSQRDALREAAEQIVGREPR